MLTEWRVILLTAVQNGGRYSAPSSLPAPGGLAALARVILAMEAAGLVNSKIHYLPGGQPDRIVADITEAGRRALESEAG